MPVREVSGVPILSMPDTPASHARDDGGDHDDEDAYHDQRGPQQPLQHQVVDVVHARLAAADVAGREDPVERVQDHRGPRIRLHLRTEIRVVPHFGVELRILALDAQPCLLLQQEGEAGIALVEDVQPRYQQS